jgi:hypothetical protein
MRSCSWCLMCLWLLKLSMALAMGLADFSSPQLVKTAASATPQEHHHAAHTQHHMAADPTDHAASTMKSATDKTSVTKLDNTHCTAHADCHHCCPLAWGNWAGMGLQAAPTQPPARQVAQWHSASWLPALRPPKA